MQSLHGSLSYSTELNKVTDLHVPDHVTDSPDHMTDSPDHMTDSPNHMTDSPDHMTITCCTHSGAVPPAEEGALGDGDGQH